MAYSTEISSQEMAEFNIVRFAFMLEQKVGGGEDADPILCLYDSSSGLLGVFDGMGGAGSKLYEGDDGKPYTGAYFAARLARKVVEDVFLQIVNLQQGYKVEDIANELQANLEERFKAEVLRIEQSPSKIKSKLIRRLPTTMAVMHFAKMRNVDYKQTRNNDWSSKSKILNIPDRRQERFRCGVFWAGDSRCYVLNPNGLYQVTDDDIESKGDALENLINDSPLSNCINADTHFSINSRTLELVSPFILISATDGCFGYVPTPAHFEYLILNSLEQSETQACWEENLKAELGRIAGDDVSMAVVALGWKDFSDLKKCFHKRHALIEDKYIKPVNELDDNIKAQDDKIKELTLKRNELENHRERLRMSLWNDYKLRYERMKNDRS
jgi:serine/threonine protein phosphatase PrpC